MKLAVRYYADPKVAGLPDADCEVLFIRGIAYSGDQETGGFVPDALVPFLARRRRYAECVDALVDAGLWIRAPGGYRMPAWSSWQDQLDVLAARRAADRERKRRKRAEEKALTSNVRGQSADVRVLEGEKDLLKQRGNVTHDPPPNPCPPRTCQRHRDTQHPPPCGPCADARRAHDTWQAQHTNGTGDRLDHRLDGQQTAQLAAAERHMADLEQQRATTVDPAANVTRLHDVRAALRPKDPT